MTLTKSTLTALSLVIASSAAFADGHAVANPMVGGAEMLVERNIIENAVN